MKTAGIATLVISCISAAVAAISPAANAADPAVVWLHELDLSHMHQDRAAPRSASIEHPLMIAGKQFARGVETRTDSALWIDLAGGSRRFSAFVGLDRASWLGTSVIFRIFGDGRKLFDSGSMTQGEPAKSVDLDLTGVRTLLLRVVATDDAVPFANADWAEARFVGATSRPTAIELPPEEAIVLTPLPGPAPRINGPVVYGCRPDHPFLYRIPTQGTRPIAFDAVNLPAGLSLNAGTGLITGTAPPRGVYDVALRATNPYGSSLRHVKIVSGDKLALTPPMGWNHWFGSFDHVTDPMVRAGADALIAKGLADVGYQYVAIDEGWTNQIKNDDPTRMGPFRDSRGAILPNRYFPDMRALTDYLHARGLKVGLYSGPGVKSCGGAAGSFGHEAQDARQFADWGFDLLKYDFCSYRDNVHGKTTFDDGEPVPPGEAPPLEELQRPYRLMGRLLEQQPRDIVYSLCQYGMGDVWKWGADAGGQYWRTAGDLVDLQRIFTVALDNAKHRNWSGPGSWNDPDLIQIGRIGNTYTRGLPGPCPLTPTEQYSFVALWSLSAAPLLYSGDIVSLDPFTVNVLANPEVIDVDQDPLGRCARVIDLKEDTFIMAKELADGSIAVGLCNRGEFPARIDARWSELGIHGKRVVRDLWRQRDLGIFDREFGAAVPRHGVVLVRLRTLRRAKAKFGGVGSLPQP